MNTSSSLIKLQGIISKMKVKRDDVIYKKIKKYGNSGMFNYATNKQYSKDELKKCDLNIWNNLAQRDVYSSMIRLPLNGFQEMIKLTEEGRLWRYPIDNEQGLEKEKEVPFEDHVFLDNFLEEFPKNEYIQSFMELVVSGLAKNHWMSVDRKREIIDFYRNYFEDKREMYKDRGFEL